MSIAAYNVRPGVHLSAQRNKLNKSNLSMSQEEEDEVIAKNISNKKEELVAGHISSKGAESLDYMDPKVDACLEKIYLYNSKEFDFKELYRVPFEKLVNNLNREIPRGPFISVFRDENPEYENWQIFQRSIHQTRLYDPKYVNIEGLLNDLTLNPIVGTELKDGGTQMKLIITFKNGGRALFKPARFSRDKETYPNHFYFSDFERHHAEIAAFHLDWVMGFYRVPPSAGRKINMTSEIKNVANRHLRHKFYKSPVDNICFTGDCSYYCDHNNPVCGNPDMLEGSLSTFLPLVPEAKRQTWRNPWRRSYSVRRKAYWEERDDMCNSVKHLAEFKKGRRLLELIDMHIFDFLMGNMDRHHYETFKALGNNSFYLHYDNGRGFGKTRHDEISILAPLFQCCQISYFTFLKLVKLYIGPERLSDIMRKSLSRDSTNPILTEAHLIALDRRVVWILKIVSDCIQKGNDIHDVIFEKGFWTYR